ncbi:MAG: hypothetical protein QOJ42_353 [Acidobacteriaceae bacterium]|nr:hypothetical protein [Acidobacteriaceae bacterium]
MVTTWPFDYAVTFENATKPVPAWPDAASIDAFLSFVLSNELCGQDRRVAQVHAEWLAAVHASGRERFEPLVDFGPQAETAHSTLECQRSPLGDAQSCPEESVYDPYHQNSLSRQRPA